MRRKRRGRGNLDSHDEALIIETRYSAKLRDSLSESACTMLNVKGKKEPRYIINDAMANRRKGNSVKGLTKSLGSNFYAVVAALI